MADKNMPGSLATSTAGLEAQEQEKSKGPIAQEKKGFMDKVKEEVSSFFSPNGPKPGTIAEKVNNWALGEVEKNKAYTQEAQNDPEYSLMGMTKQPDLEQTVTAPAKKEIDEQLINDIINGKYGVGEERRKALEALGYDYEQVQKMVNERFKNTKQTETKPTESETKQTETKPTDDELLETYMTSWQSDKDNKADNDLAGIWNAWKRGDINKNQRDAFTFDALMNLSNYIGNKEINDAANTNYWRVRGGQAPIITNPEQSKWQNYALENLQKDVDTRRELDKEKKSGEIKNDLNIANEVGLADFKYNTLPKLIGESEWTNMDSASKRKMMMDMKIANDGGTINPNDLATYEDTNTLIALAKAAQSGSVEATRLANQLSKYNLESIQTLPPQLRAVFGALGDGLNMAGQVKGLVKGLVK